MKMKINCENCCESKKRNLLFKLIDNTISNENEPKTNTFLQESLEEKLDLLKKGSLEFENPLKEYVQNGFLTKIEFNEALKIGRENFYENKLELIKEGFLSYKIEALKIATKYNFKTEKLDKAIKIGTEIANSRGLDLVEKKKLPYEIFASCLCSKYCKYLEKCKK